MPLRPRNVLVTGGGSGIGLAVARRLVARGESVLICGRRQEIIDQACDFLQGHAGRCRGMAIDLCEPEAPARAVDRCIEEFGGIDVLVNNAGLSDYRLLDDITPDTWDRSQNLMVRAPLLGIQAAARYMRRTGAGRIINNSSISGKLSEPESAQYSTAKAALISLTQTAAVELAASGIRVNAVAPGWVRTPLSDSFLADVSPQAIQEMNPVGRVGEPDEIAVVVEFLALDAPEFLTGETIYVDGGQSVFLPVPE